MYKKLTKVSKIFPWYAGLSDDLLFYIAIETIWLTAIKGFSTAQVTLLITVASLFAIFFQIFAIKFILKKLGNTKSVRIGTFCLVISSLLLTFATDYWLFILAMVMFEVAFVLKAMGDVLLKNNLKFQRKEKEFINIKSKENIIYAVATLLIALSIGFLFDLYNYLPMLLCITDMLICFILSFFIFDVNDKVSPKKPEVLAPSKKFNLPKPTKLAFYILLTFGLLYGLINIGQENEQLFTQFELQKYFALDEVAIYLGIIIFVSRAVRVLYNLIYPKLHKRLANKMPIFLALHLAVSFALILISFCLSDIIIKSIVMTLGFSLVVATRDPLKLYITNLVLNSFPSSSHQEMISYLALVRKIGTFILGIIITLSLTKLQLQHAILILLAAALPAIYVSVKLMKQVKNNKFI
ncbi:MAG: MFS transporter [Candidatus Nomurabacteria bacterium]|jgi:MFS family permease|nr:MFS transporter [Candidatus Nomurabacteria bacterium]